MGDHHHPRSPNNDSYSIFGFSKTALGKTYKFVTKWNSDNKSPTHKSESDAEAKFEDKFEQYKKGQKKKKQDEKQTNNDDPSTAGEFHRKSVDDSYFSRPSPLLAKCPTRRSHTPSARSSYLSNSTSRHVPSPTTSFLSRTVSRKSRSLTETEDSSRKGTTSESTEGSSRRGRTLSEAGEGSNRRARTPETTESRSKSTSRRGTTLSETDQNPNISRSGSRRSPIIFSQTTAARRKPPPEERKLSCTLEELCHGSVKNITIKRQIVSDDGTISQEDEKIRIKLKPGWKKGTKITFEGKGDQKPGYFPADIIFQIDQKRHPLFRREGDDLEIGVEIPLVQALTGCNLIVPLLGGEKMNLSIDEEIVYPGYEKIIQGQGMPNPKEEGVRGDLKIKFLVNFPTRLTNAQRYEAFDILKDCS
ncbi:DnaJ protein [Melia azedarach]|uniref:DnaJ protein n=1 Tax=Melia azedarach TaxID=155640 RepID=A0ACC1Y0P5_MELAZ|nr:DnaJ protein [Melia azedarach]